jgi:uncharacterized protein
VTKLYLDACSIIYLVEGTPVWRSAVTRHIARLATDPHGSLVTSRLSRLECRTKPLREGDAGLLATYEALFAADRFVLADLSGAIVERATELRVRHGLKTPDALHMATAIEMGADAFVTGDAGFARCTEVRVELVSASAP